MTTSEIVAALFTVSASIPAVLFPLLYGFTAQWWKGWVARGVMALYTGLGLLVVISFLRLLYGDDYPLKAVLRPVALGITAVGLWTMLLTLVVEKAQDWRHRRRRADR